MQEMFNDVLEKEESIIQVHKPNRKKFWWSVNLLTLASIIGIPFWPFILLYARAYYKNRFYAYSDRRIIIRGGVIGIDYKCLRFKDITATVVRVSPLDRMLKTNTGSVEFGSPGSQLGTQANGTSNPYVFQHIEKPYEVLKEINELIEEVRK